MLRGKRGKEFNNRFIPNHVFIQPDEWWHVIIFPLFSCRNIWWTFVSFALTQSTYMHFQKFWSVRLSLSSSLLGFPAGRGRYFLEVNLSTEIHHNQDNFTLFHFTANTSRKQNSLTWTRNSFGFLDRHSTHFAFESKGIDGESYPI